MIRLATVILMLCTCHLTAIKCEAQRRSVTMPFVVMEYNCENLFDCRHDSTKNDYDFLPDGERHWTFSRYWRKVNDIARVIHQCGNDGKNRHLPDIAALIEVENDSVMMFLTRGSILGSVRYRYIMTHSRDTRGIDVALLYNSLTFRPINHPSLRVPLQKGQKPTRDILYVEGYTRTEDTLHIFVVHSPSRSGNQYATEDYRLAVAKRLSIAMDSVRTLHDNANIIIMGDMNDYAYSKQLKLLHAKNMVDVSAKAKGRKAKGTYKYGGKWNSLDHILLSPSLLPFVKNCHICDFEWLLEPDYQGGYKPYRTYLGTFYHRGISDHLPLILQMEM